MSAQKIDWEVFRPVWEETPGLIGAWVFGSAKEGTVRPGSDIDIGVWLEELPSFDEQLDLLGRLEAALSGVEFDLVILNEANAILRFEAVSGRLLYCRDLSRCAGFASLAAREHEDEMAQWRRALAYREEIIGRR